MKIAFAALLACCLAAAAHAQQLPKLKPGLWEMSTTMSRAPQGQPPAKSSICLDADVQNDMWTFSRGMAKEMCSKNDIRFGGNRITGEAICTIGASRMEAKSVTTITGDSSYRTETKATYNPPLMGMTESTTLVEARHVGPCKPGQKPGDLTTAAGQTMNIKQVQQGLKKGP